MSARNPSTADEASELDPGQDPFAEEAVRHLVMRYGSPLFIIDAERVRTQYRRLAAALPGVALTHSQRPPSAIPVKLKSQYFSVS